MDPLLSRRHNSYSEAFTNYLANALKPKDQSPALVSIQKYPYPDTTMHLYRLMPEGSANLVQEAGITIFKFNSGNEGITMVYLSAEDLTHFAAVVLPNGQLNIELVDRMIELLPNQVYVGIGAESWPALRQVFLNHLYGPGSEGDQDEATLL
jgi:hypothetical protein